MKIIFRHRVSRKHLKQPNPLHILLTIVAAESTKGSDKDLPIGNFCLRLDATSMDH